VLYNSTLKKNAHNMFVTMSEPQHACAVS